jgi:hypothetical protein
VQVVTDPWLRNFIDLECFVLSGMRARDTICAEMAFMFMERNKPGSTIDFPIGGTAAAVGALVAAIEGRGGEVRLRAAVEEIVVEGGRAVGVRLKGGVRGGGNGSTCAGQVQLPTLSALYPIAGHASVYESWTLLPPVLEVWTCGWRRFQWQGNACRCCEPSRPSCPMRASGTR